jgi:hypothetical protein
VGGVDSDFCPGETDAGRWTGYVPLFRWDRALPLTTPSVEVSLHSLCVARIRLASGASSVTSFNRWQQPGLWPGKRSIVMVEVTREIGARMTKKRRCYVSSLPRTRHASPHTVRFRWRIENNLRWCCEVAFGEGQRRVRVDNAAQNFDLPRRIVMSAAAPGQHH